MSDTREGRAGGELGQAVSRAVESSGLSVHEISARTRIRATLIRDLAEGRTASSGGDVYARGHLKAIAHETGSDPAPLLHAYEQVVGPPEPTPVTETVEITGLRAGSLALPRAQAPERRTPRWGMAVGVAASVLAGLVVVGAVTGGEDPGSTVAGDGRSSDGPAAAEPSEPAPAPTVGDDARADLPPVSGAALRLRVLGGSSWVNVKGAGGRTLFEGILDDGTARDFTDPASLSITVGNAGAVSLICGGKDSPAGGPGQVRRFTCAPSGLAPA